MLLRLPQGAIVAVQLEMLLCRGGPSRLPGLAEVSRAFPSAFPGLLERVAGQDGSPEACAGSGPEHGSEERDSRAGKGEVHLRLDFLRLFTKCYFSGRCSGSRLYSRRGAKQKKSCTSLFFCFSFLMQNPHGAFKLLFF